VFNIGEEGYRRKNAFWQCHGIKDMLASLAKDSAQPADKLQALTAQCQRIEQAYAELSELYQSDKTSNKIPLN
jgi:hypothetical protein